MVVVVEEFAAVTAVAVEAGVAAVAIVAADAAEFVAVVGAQRRSWVARLPYWVSSASLGLAWLQDHLLLQRRKPEVVADAQSMSDRIYRLLETNNSVWVAAVMVAVAAVVDGFDLV